MNRDLLDVVIEVQTPCELLELLESGIQLNIDDVRRGDNNYISHLIGFPADKAQEMRRLLQKLGFEFKAVGVSGNHGHAVVTKSSCTVCRAITGHGAFMVFGKLNESGLMEFRFISDFKSYRDILCELQKHGILYRVKSVTRYRPKGVLTENQERILLIALKSGFFDYPRKISLKELATKLGLTPPTLSEVVRRGLRRLLEHYFSTPRGFERSSTSAKDT